MAKETGPAGGNVVSLAAFRHARSHPDGGAAACAASGAAGLDTVFFITGGRFEAMVNGAVTHLGPGDFLRVPEGVAHGLRDIGAGPGTFLAHRFQSGVDSGFLHELGRALPVSATTLPSRGTRAFARLKAIARRWGVALGSNAAA